MIIGSMDVEKWYPNMIAKPSAKGIREMVEESEIDFKGFDFDVVSQYLGEYLTPEEIIEEGFEEILYKKKEKAKRKLTTKKKKNVKCVSKKHVKKQHRRTTKTSTMQTGVRNMKINQTDVSLANDEGNELNAHKTEMSKDNIINNDGNDSIENNEDKGKTTHKNEVSKKDNIKHNKRDVYGLLLHCI